QLADIEIHACGYAAQRQLVTESFLPIALRREVQLRVGCSRLMALDSFFHPSMTRPAIPKAGSERSSLSEAESQDDATLMRNYRDGDARAFDALYARYAPRIHAFLLRLVADRARADDLFQVTWLHVHRARATFRDGESFAPWIYTIANN